MTHLQKKILLVEDNEMVSMVHLQALESFGFLSTHASNGEEAIQFAEKSEIDLVIMDIDLGEGMNGLETAKRIQKSKDVPILFFSSHNEKEIVEKARDISRYGYVTKGSGLPVLKTSIDVALGFHDTEKKLSHFLTSK
ncbi:MAG: response regulator [Leptospiraceae bacterium]|nr:response regulator [Leptospiraceae bacterium]MCK6380198.1 response regulator [Leptospiraceae bacterium]NUM42367.1 response regulator [Leptospiraceae bacterium]